jgi:hypothetical protein
MSLEMVPLGMSYLVGQFKLIVEEASLLGAKTISIRTL